MVFVTTSNAAPEVGVNSYVSAAEVSGYAQSHNYHPDAAVANRVVPFIFRAMDYIESYRDQFKGRKTSATQPLQWPREGVTIDGFDLAKDVVPDEIKEAVAICAIEFVSGYDPNRPIRPTDDAETSSSLSVLGNTISDRYLSEYGLEDVLPHVDALLRPLLRDDINQIYLSP